MDTGLSPYDHFAALVAIQFGWLLILAVGRRSLGQLPRNVLFGTIAGIPVGALFDIGIGKFGNIFHYGGLGLGPTFLLLNAVLSYGIAIASVLAVRAMPLAPYEGRNRRAALVAASLILGLALWIPAERWPPLPAMFLLGAAILAFGETLCAALGYRGYLWSFATGAWKAGSLIWLFSVLTGLVYEAANHLFPLWTWVNRSPTPTINMLLVISLGYFVLFYPVFILEGLLRAYLGNSSRAASAA